MERLMLLEQTTPYESLDNTLCASGGGTPGGVEGRGSFWLYPPDGMLAINFSCCEMKGTA